MRITKRPSGGRGEYEISENYFGITPIHILDRQIILNLGDSLQLTTGVRLLLRHGKRRLRIDDATGCDMHLHRQLAAALMLPHPGRDESAWTNGVPVIRSGLYGVINVALSQVLIPGEDSAILSVSDLMLANNDTHDSLSAPARIDEVRKVWANRGALPADLSSLVEQHEGFVRSNTPLQTSVEHLITAIQKSVFTHAHRFGVPHASPSLDPLPTILRILGLETRAQPEQTKTKDQPGFSQPIAQPDCAERTRASSPANASQPDAASTRPDAGMSSCPEIVPENDELPPQRRAEQHTSTRPVSQDGPPTPRRYAPQVRGAVPGPPRRREGAQITDQEREVSAPIEIRLRHRTGGTYVLSFLPRRRNGVPAEVQAVNGDQRIHLSALHEDWYQDIVISEPGPQLRNGIVIHTNQDAPRYTWSLSGRDLYVLGTREELTGFVSTPRLEIGGNHVVLCIEHLLPRVLEILRNCCDQEPTILNENDGLPRGWVALRPVLPMRSLPPSAEGDILDSIRPDPTIRIELQEGIRLQNNTWLSGYPPKIRIHGELPDFAQVSIDGKRATKVADTYVVEGFDASGEHRVACGSIARTYEIASGLEAWESWPAHTGPAMGWISGALVSSTGTPGSPTLLVPASTPVLIGRTPEEVYVASVRADVWTTHCLAAPRFRPVWAVPQHPLQSNKSMARVVFLGAALEPFWEGAPMRRRPGASNPMWHRIILDCHRKGLPTSPLDPAVHALWHSYKRVARKVRRALR